MPPEAITGILEAWAMGCPVLVRDIPVFEDWMHDGVDCLKAKSDDEFKEKLKILIEDEALRKKLVKGGQRIVKEHSVEKIGKKLKIVYEEVLNG